MKIPSPNMPTARRRVLFRPLSFLLALFMLFLPFPFGVIVAPLVLFGSAGAMCGHCGNKTSTRARICSTCFSNLRGLNPYYPFILTALVIALIVLYFRCQGFFQILG